MLPTSKKVKDFLLLPDSIRKMKKATKANRPALEPIIPDLIANTRINFKGKRIRQTTGLFAKKIMEAHGYKVYSRWDDLDSNCYPFKTASTYIKN